MPLKETEAIVLRTYPLGEGDRLVSLLDRQAGRVRGVARGARLPKSRYGSTLEMLAYIRVSYFEKETRELVRINQCELLESFMDVQVDYAASVGLALISEIADSVLEDREPAEPQFRLILLCARAIRVHGPSQVILAYFCLWIAKLGGWLGPLDRCSRCEKTLQAQGAYHSSGQAEISCESCRTDWMRSISNESLSIGKIALTGPLDRFLKVSAQPSSVKQILSYALDVLEYHMQKKLISRKTFETGWDGIIETQK
jgi:DNA repair protein RecO (recombination protein O)